MKRVICAILSVLMLVSVLNIGAVNASASSMTTSDAAIEMLKQFEGFRAEAYEDNGQYSIGYGTGWNKDKYPDGVITEAEAEEELRLALDKCENATNTIANKHGLTFTQGQFDALTLFAYNLGYGWYVGQEDTRLYKAIVNGATGNDFIFAMTMWCKASGSIHTGLVNRRLAEANMYLNGVYSKNPPANYSYVIFDGNGGSASASIQGYDFTTPVEIKVTATYSGYYFAGWYTAKKGGNQITALDDTTKGMTLYAHWQKNEPVDSGVVTADSLYVRSSASATATAVGGLTKGTKVDIYEIVATNSGKWGRVDNGWISLTYVKLDSENAGTETPDTGTETPDAGTETPDTVIATGTLTATLKIRKGPGMGYAVVDYYAEGDRVEILEMDISGNTTWGRTEKGWISLSYVKLDEVATEPEATEPEVTEPETTEPETTEPETTEPETTEPEVTEPETTEPEVTEPETTEPETTEPETTEPEATEPEAPDAVTTGTVTGTVYVRNSASASGKIIGSIPYGTDVVIQGVQCADGIIWGLTDEGWISLNYVKLHTPLEATVTTGMNVRKGAGTKYAIVDSYAAKTQVAILETVTVNGSPWGNTAKGWINLKYVQLSGIAEDTVEPETPETPETPENPETPETPETPDSVIATGKVTASALFIRKGPGTGYGSVGYYAQGDRVEILEKAITGSTTWGRTAKGWISLTYVKLDEAVVEPDATEPEATEPEATEPEATEPETPETPDSVIATGKVTASALFIRKGPGTGYGSVGYYAQGDRVEILEKAITGSTTWGRTAKGWISLTYVKLDEPVVEPDVTDPEATEPEATEPEATEPEATEPEATEPEATEPEATEPEATEPEATEPEATEPEATEPVVPETPSAGSVVATGTITASSLSVRKAPSASAKVLGTVSYGTAVEIYELQVADGLVWGRTEQGWISTNYVKLNAPLSATVTASGLFIRSKANMNSTSVGMYVEGDKVNIYETKTVNKAPWGRTDRGWINLKYVQFGGAGTGTVTPEVPGESETPTNPGTPSAGDVVASGTVTASALSIRSGASSKSAIIGSVYNGESVKIYELKLGDGILWGRTEKGWISMNYVKLNAPLTATITASTLNIRAKAGFTGTAIGFYYEGDKVTIYSTDTVNGLAWALTEKGWISLKYAELEV